MIADISECPVSVNFLKNAEKIFNCNCPQLYKMCIDIVIGFAFCVLICVVVLYYKNKETQIYWIPMCKLINIMTNL